MSPNRVLVVDQRFGYPLQLCRALARAGHTVEALAEPGAPILHSRYCSRALVSPPWYVGVPFVELLCRTVETGAYDAIYVCSEAILEILVPILETSAAWHALPRPTGTALRRLFSKNTVMRQITKYGVTAPATLVPDDEGDVLALAHELGNRIVVKGEKGGAAQLVRIVRTPPEALAAWRELRDRERCYAGRPALQEYVAGDVYLVGAVVDHGRVVRMAAHRKELMWPPEGGTTVRAVTERHDALIDAASTVFEALDYHGIADLDFIRDERDGTFKFLEINPRPWASIALTLEASDLIGAYHELARGRAVQPDLCYRVGLVFHRLSGDLRLVTARPSRLVGFVADCLSPNVLSDIDGRDLWADLVTLPTRWRHA
jgi:hypothetical protein